jgi:hypothetical protein
MCKFSGIIILQRAGQRRPWHDHHTYEGEKDIFSVRHASEEKDTTIIYQFGQTR